jgi:hypothetical protein
LEAFWKAHLGDRNRSLLFVIPESFDPRSTLALQQLLAAGSAAKVDVLAVEYNERDGGAYRDLTDQNRGTIEAVCNGRATINRTLLSFYADGRRVVATRASEIFSAQSQISPYSDVIVDISGMPRTVFFPLVARLLYLIDNYSNGHARPNLFVVVAEDAALDAAIAQQSIDEFAEFLPMFRGGFDQEATADRPTVLLPLLGEQRGVQLERILDLVKPEEVCPVLPSPSRNPRRGDNLVLEYRTLLFDQLLLDPRSFLYAAEQNPFEVYRSLREAVVRYRDALAPLGGCKVAISALSSKLMSVGALLAAYELKCLQVEVGVAHVDCQTYNFSQLAAAPEYFALWLTGECYDG